MIFVSLWPSGGEISVATEQNEKYLPVQVSKRQRPAHKHSVQLKNKIISENFS
jgi:hypothetical protein